MIDFSELDAALLHLVGSEPQSEFDLIKKLQGSPWALFASDCLTSELALFRTHFVLFNALYRMRNEGRSHGLFELEIGATRIVRQSYRENIQGTHELDKPDPLAAYYLDWQNLDDTTESDVQALIDGFWRRFTGAELPVSDLELNKALKTLSLESMPTEPTLKRHFRQLSFNHHPDRGGCPKTFLNIKTAYELVKRYLLAAS